MRCNNPSSAMNSRCMRHCFQGGHIDLAENCVYLLTQNLPHIQTDITIEGHGAVIDGQNTYRLLSSIELVNITLQDLTLRNGSYGEGGALYVQQGTITIFESTFEDNQALFGSGGALWVRQGSITITDSVFQNNTAYDKGGAIWVGTGEISVIHSEFAANNAAIGGGIYAGESTVTIINSVFTENTAHVSSARSPLYRDGNGGGAVFAENQGVSITNSTFSNNVAVVGNNQGIISVGQGGGVHAVTGIITILSSTFTGNTAYSGGAVFARDGVIRAGQSIFAENHADEQGSDIPVDNHFKSEGYNLIGDDGGGRLAIVPTDLVNIDPGFTEASDNVELSADSPARDAIPPVLCATVQDQRGTQRPQGAGCDIGAVEMSSVSASSIATATPTPVSQIGSEIQCTEEQLREALIAGGEFTLPTLCVIVLTEDLPPITNNVTLHGSSSVIDGAAQFRLLYAPGTADLVVDNMTLQNAQGGALQAARGTVTVTNSLFTDNQTDTIGGAAVYAGSGDITIDNSLFARNTAPNGGAIYAYSGDLELTRVHLEDNSSEQSGGGLWAARGQVTINEGTVTGNTAQSGQGGGIYVESGPVSITDSTFNANLVLPVTMSNYRGGAVSIGSGELIITNSQFTYNTSGAGGAVAAESGAVSIINSAFTHNLSNGRDVHEGGGGLWVGTGNATLTDSIFAENMARSSGGGAYIVEGDITVIACVFLDNSAEDAGGLGVFQGFATVTNSTFGGNEARGDSIGGSGGAFSSWGGAAFTSSTIVGNSAQNGGGIAADQGVFTLEQTIVVGNNALEGPDIEVHNFAALVSEGYNLIGYGYGLDLSDLDITTDSSSIDSRTDSFYPLTSESLALDAVPQDHCAVAVDQRGISRPQGDGCDIGAVEMEQTPEGELVPLSTSTPNPDRIMDVACTEEALREALRTGGELRLAANCHYFLTRNLPIVGSDLVIYGDGAVINGGDVHRILYAPNMARIELHDLTIQHGYTETAGGAVYAQMGAVSLDNCIIANNTSEGSGGGIASGGSVIVRNSVFMANTAETTGGGLYIAASLSISNSTFASNQAQLGGGLYATTIPAEENVVIVQSTFSDNAATDSGGGILATNVNLSLQQSIVAGNQAERDPDLSVQNNRFESLGYNVLGDNPRLHPDFRDVVVTNPKLDEFTGTYFPLLSTSPAVDLIPSDECSNDTDQRGISRPQGNRCDSGAIEMEDTTSFVPIPATPTPQPPPLTVLPCEETALREAVRIGGTYELSSGCTITLTADLPPVEADLTIQGYAVAIDGDQQYALFHGVGLADITVTGLTIRNGVSDLGGSISTEEGDITLTDCSIEDNLALDRGGGGVYSNQGIVTITRCTVQGNQAMGDFGTGGGIYVRTGNLTITNSEITENNAIQGNGGGIATMGGDVTISNTTISNNVARRGGGMASLGGSSVSVQDSRFLSNEATGWSESYGGGIYADSGQMVIERSLFLENSASAGGGLTTYWGDTAITNSTFYGNQAVADSGGALIVWYGTLTLTNCSIVGNHAGMGSGIDNVFGRLELEQTIIIDNTSNIQVGTFASQGYNLFGCCLGDVPLAETDIVTTEGGLGVYDNSTGVFPLNPDSPALDAVPIDDCATAEDQNRVSRPQGPACDIGSTEMIR